MNIRKILQVCHHCKPGQQLFRVAGLCLLSIILMTGCARHQEPIQPVQQELAGCEACQGEAEALRQGMLNTISELVSADNELEEWQKQQIQAQAILPLREDNTVVVTGIDHQIEPVAHAVASAFEQAAEILSRDADNAHPDQEHPLRFERLSVHSGESGKVAWVVLSKEGVKLVFEVEEQKSCSRCDSVIWNYRFGCSPDAPVILQQEQ
ncbi:hypothetical protein [Spongorhabdus nitratireducens]